MFRPSGGILTAAGGECYGEQRERGRGEEGPKLQYLCMYGCINVTCSFFFFFFGIVFSIFCCLRVFCNFTSQFSTVSCRNTLCHYTVFQLGWEKGRVQKKLGTI